MIKVLEIGDREVSFDVSNNTFELLEKKINEKFGDVSQFFQSNSTIDFVMWVCSLKAGETWTLSEAILSFEEADEKEYEAVAYECKPLISFLVLVVARGSGLPKETKKIWLKLVDDLFMRLKASAQA